MTSNAFIKIGDAYGGTAAAQVPALSREFSARGYVEVQQLLPGPMIALVRDTARAALDQFGRRRDLRMPATDNSPRHYRLASRTDMLLVEPAIDRLYRSRALRSLLAAICGEAVHPVPYEPEEFIATRFEQADDTHGWHWDDYAFALIWVGVAPTPEFGGSLERVHGVAWDKRAPAINRHLRENAPIRVHPSAGTVYLLRSDTTLHRVTPIAAGVRREVACFSYASSADFARKITHETIETLAAH